MKALNQKLKSLAPHGTCGCSYDTPTDLCMHHSPQVTKLQAERDQAMRYLGQLIHAHYPNLHLLDDLLGRLMQVDNGIAVGFRNAKAELERKNAALAIIAADVNWNFVHKTSVVGIMPILSLGAVGCWRRSGTIARPSENYTPKI